jgi:hypothetical protein
VSDEGGPRRCWVYGAVAGRKSGRSPTSEKDGLSLIRYLASGIWHLATLKPAKPMAPLERTKSLN